MQITLRFQKSYFALSILLLVIEILIAVYATGGFIRHYLGDYLVVILLYCMVRSLFNSPVVPTALAVLVFSYFVETTQYFHLADRLGIKSNVLRVIMGTYFTWIDIIAYTAGIASVIVFEKVKQSSPAL